MNNEVIPNIVRFYQATNRLRPWNTLVVGIRDFAPSGNTVWHSINANGIELALAGHIH